MMHAVSFGDKGASERSNTLHLLFVYGQNEIKFARPYFVQGPMLFSPLPSPLFQSQVGHSLFKQVASPLYLKMNCMNGDVKSDSFCRGAK